jgi:hypothetical protein
MSREKRLVHPDSGAGAMLGPFESRGFGIGPQINFFFPVGEKIEGVVVYDLDIPL